MTLITLLICRLLSHSSPRAWRRIESKGFLVHGESLWLLIITQWNLLSTVVSHLSMRHKPLTLSYLASFTYTHLPYLTKGCWTEWPELKEWCWGGWWSNAERQTHCTTVLEWWLLADCIGSVMLSGNRILNGRKVAYNLKWKELKNEGEAERAGESVRMENETEGLYCQSALVRVS